MFPRLTGLATLLFVIMVAMGGYWALSNVWHYGNTRYASVEECVLGEMAGKPQNLTPVAVKLCRQMVKPQGDLPDFSAGNKLADQTQP